MLLYASSHVQGNGYVQGGGYVQSGWMCPERGGYVWRMVTTPWDLGPGKQREAGGMHPTRILSVVLN